MMNDNWPAPAADSITGPYFKVLCRNDKSCGTENMDWTSNCYDTLAFVDRQGSYFNGMPENAVAPQEYSNTYIPYGRYTRTVMTLMVRDKQLRAAFTPGEGQKVVGVFDFDLGDHYRPGEVGLFMAANQAVFSDFSVTPLNEVKKFCNGKSRCMPNGLCEDMDIFASTVRSTSSSSSSSGDDDDSGEGTLVGVIIGLLIFAFCVGGAGYYYGAQSSGAAFANSFGVGAVGGGPKYGHTMVMSNDLEMMHGSPAPPKQQQHVAPDINPLRGSAY